MRKFLLPLGFISALTACEDITITESAEEGLAMCRAAALRLVEGSGAISFPSSFHDPFRDPTVVRLRYLIENSGVTGTIRCYYEDDTDDRRFNRITLDGTDIDAAELPSLTAAAKNNRQ